MTSGFCVGLSTQAEDDVQMRFSSEPEIRTPFLAACFTAEGNPCASRPSVGHGSPNDCPGERLSRVDTRLHLSGRGQCAPHGCGRPHVAPLFSDQEPGGSSCQLHGRAAPSGRTMAVVRIASAVNSVAERRRWPVSSLFPSRTMAQAARPWRVSPPTNPATNNAPRTSAPTTSGAAVRSGRRRGGRLGVDAGDGRVLGVRAGDRPAWLGSGNALEPPAGDRGGASG